jgi:hypothetical protein
MDYGWFFRDEQRRLRRAGALMIANSIEVRRPETQELARLPSDERAAKEQVFQPQPTVTLPRWPPASTIYYDTMRAIALGLHGGSGIIIVCGNFISSISLPTIKRDSAIILSLTEVPALVASFDHYGCYATYFFYSDEVLTYMSAQPTIAGYEGKVWAPFFPIDLDHPDLSVALEAARFLSTFFIKQ